MKVTKAIYITNSDQHITERDVTNSVFIGNVIPDEVTPNNWLKIEVLKINIPESLINDIISSNEGDCISKKIAEHEAAIEKLRSKQK